MAPARIQVLVEAELHAEVDAREETRERGRSAVVRRALRADPDIHVEGPAHSPMSALDVLHADIQER